MWPSVNAFPYLVDGVLPILGSRDVVPSVVNDPTSGLCGTRLSLVGKAKSSRVCNANRVLRASAVWGANSEATLWS